MNDYEDRIKQIAKMEVETKKIVLETIINLKEKQMYEKFCGFCFFLIIATFSVYFGEWKFIFCYLAACLISSWLIIKDFNEIKRLARLMET